MKKYKLEIIVFLAGAIGMGLELVAARVLSPYVGSSNVVWTSIIGIILASMSLGYWLGGKKADKDANNCRGKFVKVSAEDSSVECFVVPTDEEVMISRDTYELVK